MSTPDEKQDLFVALIGDVPLRDDREMMSAPMVSLAKRSPTRLEWTGPSGQKVFITGGNETPIATIYDFDIILWAISQVNAAKERGEHLGPRIAFHPYDLLKSISRDTGGKGYQEFRNALSRLQATRILTTIRRRNKDRLEVFNLLTEYTIDEDKQGRSLGARFTLPYWIYEAIQEEGQLLSISPFYFGLTSGLDRFLYRLARRHAGNGLDNPNGWVFSFRDLHSRTGNPSPYGQFARDLRKAIARDRLPTYTLIEEPGANGPVLRFKWRRLLL